MSCSVCGRGNCIASFHSTAEQERVEKLRESDPTNLYLPEEVGRLEDELDRLRGALNMTADALRRARLEMTNDYYNKPRRGMEESCALVDNAIDIATEALKGGG